MGKTHLNLQPSESVIVHAASRIYSAYIVSGLVTKENESEMMDKAIQAALKIGKQTDELIQSDKEF